MIPFVLAAILAADPPLAKFEIYEVPDGATMTVGASTPILLPHGYFFPESSYNKMNDEVKQLQSAAEAPPPMEINIGVKGWLIGAAIFISVGVATGFAVAKLTSPSSPSK